MSSKLSPKKKTTAPHISKSDVDFYKMSALFFILCGLVLYILKISSTLAERKASGLNMAYELYELFGNPVYKIALLVLLAASFAWFAFSKIKKKDESLSIVSSTNVLWGMLYVTFFSAFFGVQHVNRKDYCMLILAITIALAIVYYVYKIYHRDFFALTVENALLALFLYRYWHIYSTKGIIGKILLIVAFAAMGAVIMLAMKKYKSRAAKGKNVKLMFFPYWISLAFWSVFMFIKVHNPTGIAVLNLGTMLTIMLIQYIIFAIVYTIKLIRE